MGSRMNKIIKLMGLILIVMLSGCINGPVRCYLNGPFDYLTVETAKQCPVYAYPVALPAAAVCDVGIIAADTLWIPLSSLRCLVDKDCGGPLMLPFYPLIWVGAGMVSTFERGNGNHRDGVLYQRLFGQSYIKTEYGKFNVINVKKQDGSQDTKLMFDEQTAYLLPGKLINFTNNADNVVVGTSDGSVFWWQRIEGKWKSKPFFLIPEITELLKAIDMEIKDLESSKSMYSDNTSYDSKHIEIIEKKIAWWTTVKQFLKVASPVVKEVVTQPYFTEARVDDGLGGADGDNWRLFYMLKLDCQSYDFDVYCTTDGMNWNIRVHHYFSINYGKNE